MQCAVALEIAHWEVKQRCAQDWLAGHRRAAELSAIELNGTDRRVYSLGALWSTSAVVTVQVGMQKPRRISYMSIPNTMSNVITSTWEDFEVPPGSGQPFWLLLQLPMSSRQQLCATLQHGGGDLDLWQIQLKKPKTTRQSGFLMIRLRRSRLRRIA